MRFLDDADSVRGYEVLLNKDGTFQCFRWNDSFGSFTEISPVGNAQVGSVANGAVYEVKIVGDIITVSFNAVEECTYDISSISGTKYTTGNPAIAFFCRPSGDGSNPLHFGFSDITVTRL